MKRIINVARLPHLKMVARDHSFFGALAPFLLLADGDDISSDLSPMNTEFIGLKLLRVAEKLPIHPMTTRIKSVSMRLHAALFLVWARASCRQKYFGRFFKYYAAHKPAASSSPGMPTVSAALFAAAEHACVG
jgi:hypothetical protein